jgi:hypothetical protein
MSENHRFLCFGKVALAQPTLKWEDFWIDVQGYWLTIGKKVDQPCSFLIPLDLTNISAGYQDTRIQNSLCLTTSAITGSLKLYIQSPNRFDILQLYQALKTGQLFLKETITSGSIPHECSFDATTVGILLGLGKAAVTFTQTAEAITFTGAKAPPRIEFGQILSMHAKINDSGAHTRLCIDVSGGGQTATKEYDCLNSDNLKSAIACFIFNWRTANDQNYQVEAPELIAIASDGTS